MDRADRWGDLMESSDHASWFIHGADIHTVVVLQAKFSCHLVELGIASQQRVRRVSLDLVETQVEGLLLILGARLEEADNLIALLLEKESGSGELLAVRINQEKGPATDLINVVVRAALALQ